MPFAQLDKRVGRQVSGLSARATGNGAGVRRIAGSVAGLAALALCACPANALGLTSDQSSTRSYLRAELVLARRQPASYAADVTALNELAARISRECPDVAAHAPRGHELEQMEVETATATLMAELAPFRPQVQHFVRVAGHLHWTNHELTRLVHGQVTGFTTLLIAPPNLCADWKGWVATGYSAVTPNATRFVHAVYRFWVSEQGEGESAGERILHRLRPYENREDKQLVRTISRLDHGESKEQIEAVGSAQEDMEVALGLKQRTP